MGLRPRAVFLFIPPPLVPHLRPSQVMTKVVHCKREEYDIYIGRPSIWGNPFAIGVDGSREDVVDKYEKYILSNEKLLARIGELKGKVLACWCKPQACHGDVLARLAEES